MESLEEDIRWFLEPRGSGSGYGSGDGSGDGSGSGYGYGYGYGDGYGDGSGSGSGSGDGYGSGDGSGDGSGSGYGSGYGCGYGYGYGDWRELNGKRIYYVDDIPTIIDSVHGYYAHGATVREDLTLQPCYIARKGNFWAHGSTLKEAVADVEAKWMENRPLEERLDAFVESHPDPDASYDDLFSWHHTLTGSCRAGRLEWCRSHGYEPTDSITVRTFIKQTRNDYGRDAIRALAERYDIKID